jgi:hypothetical protein
LRQQYAISAERVDGQVRRDQALSAQCRIRYFSRDGFALVMYDRRNYCEHDKHSNQVFQ